jgi:ubiquinone/menaquinone biosynthesis C-methylase UbiE
MKILDAAFGHPRGLLGRLGGMIMARSTIQRNAWTIRLLTIHPGDHILDVGCGPGALIHALAEHTPDGLIAGIDTSPVILQQATKRNVQLIQRGQVQLQRASALALPFADATFDIALSANSVQLWPDQLAGVTEMRRVLKPGGQVALILQPIWVKTSDEVKALGDSLQTLLTSADFRATRCVFKEMKPIGSVCRRTEVKAVRTVTACRRRGACLLTFRSLFKRC